MFSLPPSQISGYNHPSLPTGTAKTCPVCPLLGNCMEKTCPPAQDSCWLSQLQLGGAWAGRGRGWVGRMDKVGGQRLEESGLDQPPLVIPRSSASTGLLGWQWGGGGWGGWSQHHLKPQTDLWGLLQRGQRSRRTLGQGGL